MSHPKSQTDDLGSKVPPLVYLVDDQSVLLDLAEVALRDLRLKLRKFTDPEVALNEFIRAKVKTALLITDYAMGKMNGLELIERCQELHPPLRSVVLSGSAGAEILLGAPVRVDEFLSKPYPPEQRRNSSADCLTFDGSARLPAAPAHPPPDSTFPAPLTLFASFP